MNGSDISRRAVLGLGAATAAATLMGATASTAGAAGQIVGKSGNGRGGAPRTQRLPFRRTNALTVPLPGEQVAFYTAGGMTPSGIDVAGVTSVYDDILHGYRADPGGGTGGLSTSINVPLGSQITEVEFAVDGPDHTESAVGVASYDPLISGNVTDNYLPLDGAGVAIYVVSVFEVYDGTKSFEGYFFNFDATTVCRGVRVRYIPPTLGFVPITPVRVYDSRRPMTPDASGPITASTNRTISVAGARDVATGALTGSVAVPPNAKAIAYTLTVTRTVGVGFLTVNQGGVTAVTASTINWSSSGLSLANTSTVQVDATQHVTVICGTGSTHFIIDVVGYYL